MLIKKSNGHGHIIDIIEIKVRSTEKDKIYIMLRKVIIYCQDTLTTY